MREGIARSWKLFNKYRLVIKIMKTKKLPKPPTKIVTGELRYFIYELSDDGLMKEPTDGNNRIFNDNISWKDGYISMEDAAKAITNYAKEDEYRRVEDFVIVGKVIITIIYENS